MGFYLKCNFDFREVEATTNPHMSSEGMAEPCQLAVSFDWLVLKQGEGYNLGKVAKGHHSRWG